MFLAIWYAEKRDKQTDRLTTQQQYGTLLLRSWGHKWPLIISRQLTNDY